MKKRLLSISIVISVLFSATFAVFAADWSNPQPRSTQDAAGQLLLKHELVMTDLYQSLTGKLNLLKKNFSSTISPISPSTGQAWYDTGNNLFKIYDGSTWGGAGLYSSGTSSLVNIVSTGTATFNNVVVTNLTGNQYQTLINITSNYTVTAADTGKIIVSNIASLGTITIPAATDFTAGSTLVTTNTNTNPVDVLVSGVTGTQTLYQYDEIRWWSDGSRWNGKILSPIPAGTLFPFSGVSVPSGYLLTDGTAVSRTTYSQLFNAVTAAQAATMTIAAPAVISATGHGLAIGSVVSFETTGDLPTGLDAGTNYYIITAGYGADSFRVSLTREGTVVDTTGFQTGTHTVRHNPYGCGDGSTTFNLPDTRRRTLVGVGGSGSTTLPAAIGATGGEETHLLLSAESGISNHAHSGSVPGGGYNSEGSSGASNPTIGANTAPLSFTTDGASATDAASAHNIMQPSLVVNYIIKY